MPGFIAGAAGLVVLMTDEHSKPEFDREVKKLAGMHDEFWALRTRKLGRAIEEWHETVCTVGGYSDPRQTCVGVLSPENFPLIDREFEAAVQQAIANGKDTGDARELAVCFNKIKELEAQLLRVVKADYQRMKGDRTTPEAPESVAAPLDLGRACLDFLYNPSPCTTIFPGGWP